MMRTKLITSVLSLAFAIPILAQDRTTVNAVNTEISDNLDLRAVASIFGQAQNLEDFERQINDPNAQISNLDLNNDNRVDYLRVIETVDGYTHLIVLQAVLGLDTFQDVATIEVERDRHNQVTVQVVGDVYMYGPNYIYEPVYVSTPVIYTSFWVTRYRPYCSSWYWDYYPSYYYVWEPCPVFRYRNNINVYINFSNHYNYVNVRRCERAVALYSTRRANYCERQYPTRSFAYRNTNVRNRYELDQTRSYRTEGNRNQTAYSSRNSSGRNNAGRDYNSEADRNARSAATGREYRGRNEANTQSNPGSVRESGRGRNSDLRNNPNQERAYNPGSDRTIRNNTNSGRDYSPSRNSTGARMEANSNRDFNRNDSRNAQNSASRTEQRDFSRNEIRGNIAQRMESGREYNPSQRDNGNRTNSNSGRDFTRNENRGSGNIAPRMETARGNSEMRSEQRANPGNGGGQRNNDRGGRR